MNVTQFRVNAQGGKQAGAVKSQPRDPGRRIGVKHHNAARQVYDPAMVVERRRQGIADQRLDPCEARAMFGQCP